MLLVVGSRNTGKQPRELCTFVNIHSLELIKCLWTLAKKAIN